VAISKEERNRRARERYRRKHWEEWDCPPSKPGLYNCLLPYPNHHSSPRIDSVLVPPDRKPLKPRVKKSESNKDQQMTIEDAVLKRIIEEFLEGELPE